MDDWDLTAPFAVVGSGWGEKDILCSVMNRRIACQTGGGTFPVALDVM
jgi:hypothetical protein